MGGGVFGWVGGGGGKKRADTNDVWGAMGGKVGYW